MRGFLNADKHRKIAAALSAAAFGLMTLPASAADVSVRLNATPLPRYVQAETYGDYYSYNRPACPARYYYSCRTDAFGNAQCACWPGLAYYIFRY
ncbi:MAG TPA: hypothetical protein VH206_12610 [Xanthobacteraceae bacterium]|jgi:hypothetical protein|nr:hypothetical protein [Xanthobacteraceae bacterium]